LRKALRAWLPRLPAGRAIGWNVGAAPHTFPWRQANLLEAEGLEHVRTIVWEKPGVPRPSSYQMVRSGRVRHFTADYTFELVFLASKGPLERGGKADLGEQLDRDIIRVHMNMGARYTPSDASAEGRSFLNRRGKGAHPTAFPPSLPEAFIRHFADPGAVVADPFGGIGSTAVAAARCGRVGLSVEIDPRYCDVALLRLERETGGKAEEA
jgi:DNA modification methylase